MCIKGLRKCGIMKARRKYIEKFVGMTPKKYEESEDRHKKVLKIFSRYNFERILDVGCGDGNFTKLIAEACKAKEVYGIEISENGVEMAKKNGIKCIQLDVDGKDLPFDDNFFDAIFAGELMEHLFDPDHFLDEVYRVLKPEGIFVLTTPNLASIYNRFLFLLGYLPIPMDVSFRYPFVGHLEIQKRGKSRAEHIRLFTFRALKELLQIHNFSIIKTYTASFEWRAVSKKQILVKTMDRLIHRLLSPFPGLSHIIIFLCAKR